MATHTNKGFTPRMRRTVQLFTCQVPNCGVREETASDLNALREKTFLRYGVRALLCSAHYEKGNFDWVQLEIAMMQKENKK